MIPLVSGFFIVFACRSSLTSLSLIANGFLLSLKRYIKQLVLLAVQQVFFQVPQPWLVNLKPHSIYKHSQESSGQQLPLPLRLFLDC